jgi:hypothetical protein
MTQQLARPPSCRLPSGGASPAIRRSRAAVLSTAYVRTRRSHLSPGRRFFHNGARGDAEPSPAMMHGDAWTQAPGDGWRAHGIQDSAAHGCCWSATWPAITAAARAFRKWTYSSFRPKHEIHKRDRAHRRYGCGLGAWRAPDHGQPSGQWFCCTAETMLAVGRPSDD